MKFAFFSSLKFILRFYHNINFILSLTKLSWLICIDSVIKIIILYKLTLNIVKLFRYDIAMLKKIFLRHMLYFLYKKRRLMCKSTTNVSFLINFKATKPHFCVTQISRGLLDSVESKFHEWIQQWIEETGHRMAVVTFRSWIFKNDLF